MATEALRTDTAKGILNAAKVALLESGYSGLSTRAIAETAGVPLSQIHYHFGSKQNLVLALLERENQALLSRQEDMFESDLPLSEQWDRSCDYLDRDIDSGYVRVLHEMIAAGWSDPEIGKAVWDQLDGWKSLHISLLRRTAAKIGGIGPFEPDEVSVMIEAAFIGAEAYLLLGVTDKAFPIRKALRKVGDILRRLEEEADAG